MDVTSIRPLPEQEITSPSFTTELPFASLQFTLHAFIIHSLHAFRSVDQVRCSRHSMAALQPALSWDFFHRVYESPAICKSSLT